ncbi:hypothetical protein ACGRHY_27005 [Streptomyces sp. HK10]|uniref:hypothetical protein n=1 Tax=Streptomyces sp. HK10 TaxID=3373255 RepID=UPI00374A03DE
MNLFPLVHRTADPAPTETSAAAVSYLMRYVNRDAVSACSGPGPAFAPIGQLFYLDCGIKLREVDGWVQLRLRYRSASGLAEGATAWLPEAWTSPCTPPGH